MHKGEITTAYCEHLWSQVVNAFTFEHTIASHTNNTFKFNRTHSNANVRTVRSVPIVPFIQRTTINPGRAIIAVAVYLGRQCIKVRLQPHTASIFEVKELTPSNLSMRRAIQTYLLFIQSQHDTHVIMHSINKVIAASHCSVFGQQNSTRVCNYDLILHRSNTNHTFKLQQYKRTSCLSRPIWFPFHTFNKQAKINTE